MNRKLINYIESCKSLTISELAKKFKCNESEICMGDYIAANTADTVCPYKVIMGFANFENSFVTDLGKLKVVFGSRMDLSSLGIVNYLAINFKNSNITSTKNLTHVYGSMLLNDKIETLGKIKFLGNNLYLNNTKVTSLGDLKTIYGIISLDNSILPSLGSLQKVNKIICLENFKLEDLGDLEKFQSIELNISDYLKQEKKVRDCKHDVDDCLKNLSKLQKRKYPDKENIKDVQEQIAKFQVNLNREQAKLNKMPQTKNIKIQIENKFIHNDYGYFRKDLLVSE